MFNLKRVSIIFIIIITINCVSLLIYFNFPYKSDRILVGTFYYVWYGENRHWNDGPLNVVIDIPYTKYYNGYYSYNNETLIFHQLKLIEECGIDFLIISWTKPYSFEDNATKRVFKVIKEHGIKLKAAIMVEPVDDYDNDENKLSKLKSYIFENYIVPYDNQYFYWKNKPLVGFFVPLNPPEDELFSFRVIGEQPYAHWPYWNVPPKISKDGVVAILPRYDDSHLSRDVKIVIDKSYANGLYDSQWDFVRSNKDKISIILITSWNEYHERTMIEPHIDATALVDNYHPYYIYDKTKIHIQKLKEEKFYQFGILSLISLQLILFCTCSFVLSSINKIYKGEKIRKLIIIGVCTRIIVIIAALLSNSIFGLRIPFEGEELPDYELPVLNLFSRWDSGYYLNIAAYGYYDLRQWAFRPLFPLVLKLLSIIIFKTTHPSIVDMIKVGFLLNNIIFLFMLLSFYNLTRKFLDDELSLYSTILFITYPTSFIFSAIYPESLFYLLIFSGFIYLEENKIIKSSIFISLAGLCRPEGFIVFIIYIIKALLSKKNILKYVLCSLIVISSFFAFLVYSFIITNSFFTPIQAELLWSRKGIIDMIRNIRNLHWNFNPGLSLIYLIINLPLYFYILFTLLYYYVKPILSFSFESENCFLRIFPYIFHSTIYFIFLSIYVDYISFARLSLFLFPIFWIIALTSKNKVSLYFSIFLHTILLIVFLSLHVNWYHIT